ncbi:MAG TPA: MFS transporter [Candidatus Saccharimonadales bacterium]|nr:MFS transporter [Candidatus Saccharimonadales bacterium]
MTASPSPSNGQLAAPITAGIAATTIVALPTMLVGGLAILMGRDMGFGASELGIAIAATFAAGAIAAVPAGRLAERVGPRRTTQVGLAFGLASLLGIGLVARSWPALVICLAIAGIGITTVQLGVNVLVARAVPADRQGIAFGAKQAAVPLASMVAGLAVPAIGLTVGWPAAFLLAAIAVPLVAIGIPDAGPGRRPADASTAADPPVRALVLLAVGVALASAGGNSVPAFTVASAVDHGFEPAAAGLLLVLGGFVGILVRVVGGWVGDRLGRGALLLVVALVTIGTVGFLGLALVEAPILIAVCTALAFGGGWGWGGLVILAVARTSPVAPGRAMGIVQVGPMAGAIIGPLAFGWLAANVAFDAAWAVMAGFSLFGAGTILLSRRRLLRSRPAGLLQATEPIEPDQRAAPA